MIDSCGYAQLVAGHPRLYHLVWDADEHKLCSIREHGLERTGSHWSDHWRSRPGHTYLATAAYARHARYLQSLRSANHAVLAIDTGQLVASAINPDEDHFLPCNVADLGERNVVAGKHVLRRFHLPFPPCQWMREWTDYMGWRPLPSVGEWADQIDLGSDPAQTRYSILKGSIAYRGVVPPSVITVVREVSA